MLHIDRLTKRYGPVLAADEVSLRVRPGRMVGFVGPNGAGKSTTMRAIFGLVVPDSGTITWRGEPVDRDHRTRFGYMPEQRGLYPKMPIADQVAYFAELQRVERARARARATELLTSLGLGERLTEPLEKLSHGNQQRVQLAVSLANDPELLVLDEPFSGLDPVAVDTLQEVLTARVADGAGVLFSSHQLDLVERLCDEIVIIADGRVRAAGTVNDVRSADGVRHVLVRVDRPRIPLRQALAGLAVSRIDGDQATVVVASDREVADVLDRARRAGTVARLDFDLPTLTERFAAIVTAPDPGDERAETAPATAPGMAER
ncbi:MAG: ATP-binding cassette domain-containing protein [Actinomycetota bacterium]